MLKGYASDKFLTYISSIPGSRCSIYNDPHFHTFDGHHYDFHGVCNYSLAQRGFTREAELGVYGDFRSCWGRASCLGRTTFVNDPHTVVALESGSVFTVSGARPGGRGEGLWTT